MRTHQLPLPGGWGTLDEFFEVLTWRQLQLHHKPCGLLNVEGYFDTLLSFMTHVADEGFVRRERAPGIIVASAAEALLDRLVAAAPSAVEDTVDLKAT